MRKTPARSKAAKERANQIDKLLKNQLSAADRERLKKLREELRRGRQLSDNALTRRATI